jgi:autotransporter-associated beta strand protein
MLSLNNDGSSFTGIVRIEEGTLRTDNIANAFFSSSLGTATSTDPSRLVIAGGALSFNNAGPVSTNRSITIGAGSMGAAIFAEGPGRESAVNLGFFSPSGTTDSPAVAFEGAGERTLTLGARNDGLNTFNLILGDAGAGQPTSIRKIGYGQWALTRDNTFTGLVTVEDGELRVIGDGALGEGVSGGGLGTEIVSGRLLFSDVNYTHDEDLFFLGGSMQVRGGESTFGGRFVFNRFGTIFVDEGATLTHTGDISGNQPLNFESPGTLVLAGSHTTSGINRFVGTVTIREGTLVLDYSTNNSSKLAGQLQMGGGRRGGTLVLRGGSHREVVSQLFINTGTNRVIREVGSNATIDFNNINNNSSGNLFIDVPGYTTTNRRNTNGILGSSIVIGDGAGGISWAVNSTNGNDGPISAFTAFSVDNWGNNLHVDARNDSSQSSASTAYTLRFNQPATPGDVTVTLQGGNNELQSGGILVTPQMGTNHAIIAGPGMLSSGNQGLRNTDDLLFMQYNTQADLVISAPIVNGAGTDGIEKLGEGRVVLLGAHSFTGAIDLGEGEISIDTLANGGVASGLGAGGTGSGNLLFNAGTLAYLGETASTNRAFNVQGPFARFRIGHDRTTATFGGNNAGGELIIKEGSGTMAMTNRSTGILGWEVNEGTVEYHLNGGNNRFASGISEMTAGGGKVHVIGDTAANRSQQFGGQLTIAAGASTFQVTSVFNSGGTSRNATLQLQGGEEDFTPIRNAGGSAHFIEDPFVDSSMAINTIAQILLNIPISERQQVIPWATYKDNSLFSVEGVNEFATVDSNVGGVTDASAFTLHDIGLAFNNPDNWLAGDDVSEAIAGFTSFGLDDGTGATGGVLTGDRSVRTIKFFTPEDSSITIPNGNELTLVQGAILLPFNVRQGLKSIGGDGNISGTLAASDGGQELLIHNYNMSAPFTLSANIVDGTFSILANFGGGFDGGNVATGSAVMEIGAFSDMSGVNVGDVVTGPGIGADTTVVAVDTMNGTITLSQPATADAMDADYVFTGRTHFSQAGIGTTILAGNNQYNGNTYVHGGVVRLDSANAIPGGIGSTGGTSALFIDGGVLGLGTGDFQRPLNDSAEGVQLTGSGGFAAYGADRTVNFGGAGAEVAYGRGGFIPNGSTLVLGAPDSTHKVTLVNPIDIGFQTQMIRTENGLGAIDGELGGALRGEGKLIKIGLGQLRFSVANEHTGGTQLAEGSLRAANVANVFGTGLVEIGTSTTHTIPESALDLIFEGGSPGNAITVGTANSTGITSLTSEANTTLGGNVALGMRTFMQSETGIETTLNGVVSGAGGVVVTSGGQLTLTNAGNNYGTAGGAAGSAVDGGTVVRSGSIVVTSNGALGSTTVELGDAVPNVVAVDRATTAQSLAKLQGRFDADHDGFFDNAGGPGAFVEVSDTIDGRTFTAGDAGALILVKNEFGDPEQNGVYEVVFDAGQPAGTMNLRRASVLDADAELLYGTRVDVSNGSFAGNSFFIASPGSTVNTSPVHFLQDDLNANVSLLAGTSGLTISNSIDINATNGSGNTTIGAASSVTSGTVTISGPVTLQDVQAGVQETKQLRLTSSTNTDLGVILSGLVSEADTGMGPTDDVLSLFKTGTGTATLTNANTFTGGATVDQGTLLVNNSTGSGTGTGPVMVNAAGVLGGTGTLGGDTTVSGQLRPGSPVVNDGVGTINFGGALTLGSGSQTFFTLIGDGVNDRFIVDPAGDFLVDAGAGFVVELGNSYVPLQGDSFDLFDWTSLDGGSDMDWTDQITLPNTVAWNLSLLNSDGIISVIPEPSRVGLFLMGLLALMRRRR